MSEVKLSAVPAESAAAPRTLDDCQKQYQNLCLQAGHIQYQIDALSKDLRLINDTLRDVNLEAKKLQDAAKAAEAPAAEAVQS